jgi:hypothetical protein
LERGDVEINLLIVLQTNLRSPSSTILVGSKCNEILAGGIVLGSTESFEGRHEIVGCFAMMKSLKGYCNPVNRANLMSFTTPVQECKHGRVIVLSSGSKHANNRKVANHALCKLKYMQERKYFTSGKEFKHDDLMMGLLIQAPTP